MAKSYNRWHAVQFKSLVTEYSRSVFVCFFLSLSQFQRFIVVNQIDEFHSMTSLPIIHYP